MLRWNLILEHTNQQYTLGIVPKETSWSLQVSAYQCSSLSYDKPHLKIKGQCIVTVQVLGRKIVATLIMVDIKYQVSLLGRNWMVSFGLDLPTIVVDIKYEVSLFGKNWMVSFGLDIPQY